MIEKFVSENPQDFGNMLEPMRRAASIRYREYIRETLAENSKKNYFVRIYPAKGSDIYDSYFSGPRTYNKILYKALYTDEVMRCTQPKPTTDMKLGYKIDIPPTSYDQYRKQQQDRV